MLQLEQSDPVAAERSCREGLRQGDRTQHGYLGYVLHKSGRLSEALDQFEIAERLGYNGLLLEHANAILDGPAGDAKAEARAEELYRAAILDGERNAYANLGILLEEQGGTTRPWTPTRQAPRRVTNLPRSV